MQSFAAIIFAASILTAVSGQATFNPATGKYTCALDDATFCAGGSGSNILITCLGGVGRPSNCNDNLSGQAPLGDSSSPCYESSPTKGDAACSKNCVIYQNQGTPESASEVSASTVPGCTAGTGPTSTSGPDTSSGVGVSTIEPSTTGSAPSYTVSPVSVSATSYTVSPVSSVSATGSTSVPAASVSATPGVGPTVSSNGTGSTQPGGPVSTGSAAPTGITTIPGSATSSGAVTPVSPTPSPSQFTNGAVAQTGSFVAGIGMFAAYFL